MYSRLTFSFVSAATVALIATPIFLAANRAEAQQSDAIMEEVVVEAPMKFRQARTSNSAATVELIELKRRVNYADLDLSKHVDVIELEARVEKVSKESCQKLFDMYPFDSASERRRCIKKAIGSAEKQVHDAIVAAN